MKKIVLLVLLGITVVFTVSADNEREKAEVVAKNKERKKEADRRKGVIYEYAIYRSTYIKFDDHTHMARIWKTPKNECKLTWEIKKGESAIPNKLGLRFLKAINFKKKNPSNVDFVNFFAEKGWEYMHQTMRKDLSKDNVTISMNHTYWFKRIK